MMKITALLFGELAWEEDWDWREHTIVGDNIIIDYTVTELCAGTDGYWYSPILCSTCNGFGERIDLLVRFNTRNEYQVLWVAPTELKMTEIRRSHDWLKNFMPKETG